MNEKAPYPGGIFPPKAPPAGSPARGALWALTGKNPGGRQGIPKMYVNGGRNGGVLPLTEKGEGKLDKGTGNYPDGTEHIR